MAPKFPPNTPHWSGEVPTAMGVIGTLGTADTAGSAQVLPMSVDPATGAQYVYNLGPAGSVSLGDISGGTIDQITTGSLANIAYIHEIGTMPPISVGDASGGTLDTIGTLGSVANVGQVHNAGTIASGSLSNIAFIHSIGTMPAISIGESTGGTLDIITRVGNVGTLEVGTVSVSSIPQISVGTVPNVNIATGTQQTLGTVGNLNNGTVRISVGTITTGSLTNLATLHNGTVVVSTIPQVSVGTLPTLNLTTGTVTTGSLANIGYIHEIGTMPPISIGESTGGTLDIITRVGNVGTVELGSAVVTSIPQISVGTLPTLNVTTGTITTGSLTNLATLHNGTVRINPNSAQTGTSIHTRGTTGAAVWGTIVAAAGAGTLQYVSNVDIVVTSGTVDVAVTNIGVGGTTGAGVLARGQFAAGGGISKSFDPVSKSGTNGTIAYWLGGAGTVDINVTYWQST